MRSFYKKQQGFTLVELMVVVSLIGVLLMLGSSLTSVWVASAQVNSTASAFKNSIYQARITALRNSGNKDLSQAAASVCIEDNIIKVIAIAQSMTTEVCETTYNKPVQKTSVALGVGITQNGQPVSCMAFSPAGLVIPATGCSSDVLDKIRIKKSSEEVEIDVI